ncbi:MAG: thiamine diphosphokinase [Eubacteriales bacterium]
MKEKCILIGAGDISVSEIPIKEGDYVIAVDGGYMYCKVLGIQPDLIIGDFDSVEEKEMAEIESFIESGTTKIISLPREKDDTDMLAALRYGLEKGFREFCIYAACGGRLEHTIANIQCLNFLKEQKAKGYLMDGTGMVLVAKNESITFQKSMEGFFSMFSLGETAKGVSVTGMKYELDGATFTNAFPIGISNEFIGEAAKITVEEGTVVMILSW